jgi:hypothetical protein
MVRRLTISFILVVLFVAAGDLRVEKRAPAEAAPPGAATGQFVFEQHCLSNGLVLARFAWAPSGWGHQFVDVSLSSTFNGWDHSAQLSEGQRALDWFNLQPSATYYSRIGTWIGVWVHSDTISFRTIACAGGFSPARNLRTSELSSTTVRVEWDRGNDNQWFCIDTAHSVADLYAFQGSWQNHHCRTTSSSAVLRGLACNSSYYWRIWAVGSFTTGHSDPAAFSTTACTFAVPDDTRDEVLSPTSVRFSWSPGIGNQAYCVDTALSLNDLLSFSGTWGNHCWTAEPTITATNLRCNTLYYWRVYAAGPTGDGHSRNDTVTTGVCG